MKIKNKFIDLLQNYNFNKMINFIQEIIQSQSLSGQERKVVTKAINKGVNLGFDESLAHVVNEYISIDEIKKAFKGYAAILNELLV